MALAFSAAIFDGAYSARPCSARLRIGHGRHLPNDLLRRLVLAYALECRLAQQSIRGPATEMRLDHHPGLDPAHVVAAGLGAGDLREGRLFGLQCVEPLPQIPRHHPRVAGADAAGIDQPAFVIIPDDQCAYRLQQRGRR
jgi:hypothetical protein